jgi:hypothetical protein
LLLIFRPSEGILHDSIRSCGHRQSADKCTKFGRRVDQIWKEPGR